MKERVEKCHPLTKLMISGYQLIKDQMEKEGLLTDETTFSEICLFAGKHVRIIDKDDTEPDTVEKEFSSLHWLESVRKREK